MYEVSEYQWKFKQGSGCGYVSKKANALSKYGSAVAQWLRRSIFTQIITESAGTHMNHW